MAVSTLGLQIIKKDAWIPEELKWKLRQWSPKSELGKIIRESFRFLPMEMVAEILERITNCLVIESSLSLVIFRHPDSPYRRGKSLVEDIGIVSRKVVTTTGVGFIVDAFQNLVELEIMKYHGIGTSTAAEGIGNTGLTAEATTQYNPDNTRATGSLEEGASANIFKTIGTNTVDGAIIVEEHGVFSQAATGGGVLLDRSLTGTQTLSIGDGLQSTYQFTCSAGG